MQKRITKNEIIRKCHTILNELGTDNNMNLNWVPGHKRYEGNERADHLAKLGLLKYPLNRIYNKIPFTNYENKIDEYYQKSILNSYKYSGISDEAKIFTNELLKTSNYNLKNITKQIISYSDCKLAILT